jgi:outer membrane protein assembly factor BamB
MRRRRCLQVLGGCLIGALAGCTTGGQVFETYRYERDAPVDGPVATPWRTQAHDARRSGYAPYGQLPPETTADLFANVHQTIEMQPAFVDGVAYFGARRAAPQDIGDLGPSGLKAADSRRDQWFVPEHNALASPTVVGDAIFVTSDGTTRALDRRDGTLCWEYSAGASHPTACPTVVGDTVYVTGERVVALAATTGEVQWATTRPEGGFRGTAARSDGVFATARGEAWDGVYRFDTETGRERWVTPTDSGLPVPPVLGEFVYVTEATGQLRALDPSDGTEAWSRELGGDSSAMPAVAEGTVYAAATNGDSLLSIDASTGDLRWESGFDALNVKSPTVAGDSVYLPASVHDGGLVYEFAADSGRIRGAHELPRAPTTPLVVGVDVGLIGTGLRSSRTKLQFLSRPDPEP